MNRGFETYPVEIGEILRDIYLIDIIVENCRSDELRKAILKRDHNLREIEEIAATIEDTELQLKDLKDNGTLREREGSVYEIANSNRSPMARTFNRNNYKFVRAQRTNAIQHTISPKDRRFEIFSNSLLLMWSARSSLKFIGMSSTRSSVSLLPAIEKFRSCLQET